MPRSNPAQDRARRESARVHAPPRPTPEQRRDGTRRRADADADADADRASGGHGDKFESMPGSCSPHWELNEHPEEAIPEAHCGSAKVLSHQVAIGRPRGRHPSSRRQRVSGCLRWWPRRNRDMDHQEPFLLRPSTSRISTSSRTPVSARLSEARITLPKKYFQELVLFHALAIALALEPCAPSSGVPNRSQVRAP